ncbi:hypothetical protein HDU93_003471 [Gonapodya sp. JEL0774]|nr:hypothetical protein HDU93_003471 [Gonapodya sp. JEL0774]
MESKPADARKPETLVAAPALSSPDKAAEFENGTPVITNNLSPGEVGPVSTTVTGDDPVIPTSYPSMLSQKQNGNITVATAPLARALPDATVDSQEGNWWGLEHESLGVRESVSNIISSAQRRSGNEILRVVEVVLALDREPESELIVQEGIQVSSHADTGMADGMDAIAELCANPEERFILMDDVHWERQSNAAAGAGSVRSRSGVDGSEEEDSERQQIAGTATAVEGTPVEEPEDDGRSVAPSENSISSEDAGTKADAIVAKYLNLIPVRQSTRRTASIDELEVDEGLAQHESYSSNTLEYLRKFGLFPGEDQAIS